MNRNVGIAVTIVTALCCVCLALVACGFGGFIATGQPFTATVNDVSTTKTVDASWGYFLICLSIIFIVIPVVVGFIALRKKPIVENESVVVPPP